MKIFLLIASLLLPVPSVFAQADWTAAKTADLSQLDQVRYAQLTAAEKLALNTLTTPAVQKCATGADVADTLQRVRVRRSDLGGGTQGFVVEGTGCLCDAGNCEFWLVTSDMTVLFDGMAQTYALLPQLTNDRYDFVTASHVSTTESTRAMYTFDGTKYQSTQCADITLANAFGSLQMKPTITVKKCQ